MGRDARVDARRGSTTDARRGRVGSRLSVCVVSRYRRWTVRDSMIYKFCLSSVYTNVIRMGIQCAYIYRRHISRGVRLRPQSTPTSVDGTREARASSEHRTRARSFVRSFVRSFGTSSTRRPRRDASTHRHERRRRTGNHIDDGIRRDVDARRVSSSVSRSSMRRCRSRCRSRPRSRSRARRARAGR